MRQRIHIYPVDKHGRTKHCTDHTGMCGCRPDQMQACDESDDCGVCVENCWRCKGSGLVPADNEPDGFSILIIHKENYKPVYPDYPDSKLSAK